jgi:predicted nucleotide-binding protein (sugar kinase/HSP70/actin superfamily)
MAVNTNNSLLNRTLYIPQMSYEGARCMAAAFQSIGVAAEPNPAGDAQTYELARKYLAGDECLPEAVTLGNFLKVTQSKDYDPARTAFMMPTSNGPCRFGHYFPLAKKIFRERGEPEVLFVNPTSNDGYKGIGGSAGDLVRTGWRAIVAADALRKLLLKTRPYEAEPGETDGVFYASLDKVCRAISTRGISHKRRLDLLANALEDARDAFRAIEKTDQPLKPLIGIVGEIFCRLNEFSNESIIRVVEKYDGEAWMSDVSEWVWYTNDEEEKRLIDRGKRLSFKMLGCKVKQSVMHADERRLLKPFEEDFIGYEEPHHISQVLELSKPYLPREIAHGEMVINLGRSIWYWQKGAAGVIDVSPFTCMNGIVCEAVYPRVSKELGGFPMRVFYFDGLQSNLDSYVEIFMELAKHYAHKNQRRVDSGRSRS